MISRKMGGLGEVGKRWTADQAQAEEDARVRVGLDLMGVYSSCGRGIGRYGLDLSRALIRAARGGEAVAGQGGDGVTGRGDASRGVLSLAVYVPDDVSAADVAALRDTEAGDADASAPVLRRLPRAPGVLSELCAANPDRLDVLLVMSPFELEPYAPPGTIAGGPLRAAVVYDMIPYLYPREYLASDPMLERVCRKRMALIRGYDRLLAISESARNDAVRVMGADPARVVTIGTASDPSRFYPAQTPSCTPDEKRQLARLGVNRKFVLCVGNVDERKNLSAIIDAFGRMPAHLRSEYQIVLTSDLPTDFILSVRSRLRGMGAAGLVAPGRVDDLRLRLLYQRCAVMVFPSVYEGFGLPLLEAMHCGATVVGGDNSSQPEVIGDAGSITSVADAWMLSRDLVEILEHPERAETVKEKALQRAAMFSWDDVAARALGAINAMDDVRGRAVKRVAAVLGDRVKTSTPRLAHCENPRVALSAGGEKPRLNGRNRRWMRDAGHVMGEKRAVMPGGRRRMALGGAFPPLPWPSADRALAMALGLRRLGSADVYFVPGAFPLLGTDWKTLGCHESRIFGRWDRIRPYDAVIEQVALWLGPQCGAMIRRASGRAVAVCEDLEYFACENGVPRHALPFAPETVGMWIVRTVPAQLELTMRFPETQGRIRVAPPGADPVALESLGPAARASARSQLGLSPLCPVLCVLDPLLNEERYAFIRACLPGLWEVMPDLVLFVGGGIARQLGRESDPRLRIVTWLDSSDRDRIYAASDIGLSWCGLEGEIGPTLRGMAHRLPMVVLDHAGYSGIPDAAAPHIDAPYAKASPDAVNTAMRELIQVCANFWANPEVRQDQAQRGWEYVTRMHHPAAAARSFERILNEFQSLCLKRRSEDLRGVG